MHKIINSFFKIGSTEAAARALSWLTPFVLALILPASEYGLVTIFIAIENIFLAVYMAGLDKAILRFGSDENVRNNVTHSCTKLWAFQSMFITLIIGVSFYIAERIDYTFIKGISQFQLAILLSGIAFVALNRIHNAQMRVFKDGKGFFVTRLVAQAARIIFIIAVIKASNSAVGYIYGTLIYVLIVLYQVIKNIKLKTKKVIKKKEILMFSWPYIPHALAGSIIAYSDKLILQKYAALEDVGSYGFSYLIGSGITFIYGVMASYFEPYFYSDGDDKRINPLGYVAMQIVLGILFGYSFILLVIYTGLDAKYKDFFSIALIILSAYLFHPIYLSGNYMLAKQKRTAHIASGTFVAGFVTVFLNLELVPLMGARGAAIATLAGFATLSVYIGFLSSLLSVNTKRGFALLVLWLFLLASSVAAVLSHIVALLLITLLVIFWCLFLSYRYVYRALIVSN